MLESHIHLIHWFTSIILPCGEFKTKVIFMLNKDRVYSTAVDNAVGAIHKDSEGENIPDIAGKTNYFPFCSTGAGKESVSE